MNSIIYTAIVGNRDYLKAQPETGDEFIAFLDYEVQLPPWRIINADRQHESSRLEAKRYKILPHAVLPPHHYSLWIDGRIELKTDQSVQHLAEQFLGDADLALFAHYKRTCIYEEAWEVRAQGLDQRDVIYSQMARYTREGYPANNGLHECSVILRRNTARMREFNELWWHEITNGSIRDQLSFDYLAFKLGLKVAEFPGDLRDNPYFLRPARTQQTSICFTVAPFTSIRK